MISLLLTFWPVLVLALIIFLLGIFKPKIKGIIGEKTVSVFLSRLDKSKYKVINDVMIRHKDKTSQIDHVVVSNYGIFVIETKNYKGWILGNEYSKYWTQVIYKRKEKLYNPIRQNYGHVQALKENLSEFGGIKFIPIVVFSTQTELKVEVKSEVIYTVKLLRTIKKYKEETINDESKEAIYNKIVSSNINSRDTRKEHVANIKQEKYKEQRKVNEDSCPKCGGTLVKRKGKYGYFKGCNNYPKCRYTVKL